MQTATSETESKSLDLSICVHHYTLRAPCPKGQGTITRTVSWAIARRERCCYFLVTEIVQLDSRSVLSCYASDKNVRCSMRSPCGSSSIFLAV